MSSKGIPTKYGGTLFRSRLEARYACFFDLIAWKWEFEPFDLNGYIPDFVITNYGHPFLVEIKPSLIKGELEGEPVNKIEQSGWTHEYCVLGGGEFPCGVGDGLCLGIMSFFQQTGVDGEGNPAYIDSLDMAVFHGCEGKGNDDHVGLIGDWGSWRCRICNHGDGAHHLIGTPSREELLAMWREAGNRVQWKGRGGR